MKVSLSALPAFAKDFVAALPRVKGVHAHAVTLSGELGAGKTTFVQSVARELGVNALVTSPTFILLQLYAIDRPPFKRLIHVDAYRLSPGEKDTIGWSEYGADPENLILLEWPERLPGGAPRDARGLEFKVVDETTRDISEKKS